jgi:hypothetical protein
MKYFYLAALVCILASCKSKEQKLKEKIIPVIDTIVLKDSLVHKIDSIKILKIDTLTDSLYAERTLTNKLRYYEFYTKMLSYNNDELGYLLSDIKLKRRQLELYSDLDGFSTLRKITKEEADDKIQEFKEKAKVGGLYQDSITLTKKEIAAISERLKQKKYNTKNFRGYFILFNILGSDKRNLEVRKDSLNLYLSPSFRVIPINHM